MKKLIAIVSIVAVCCVISNVDAGTYSERHKVSPNGRHVRSQSHARGRQASCSAASFGVYRGFSGCSSSRSRVRASASCSSARSRARGSCAGGL